MADVLPLLDGGNLQAALDYEPVYEYVMRHGRDKGLLELMEGLKGR